MEKMNQEITIRDAQPEDIPDIEAIAGAAWEPYFAYRRQVLGESAFHAEHRRWQEDKARQVRSNARGERGCRAFVAQVDERVVGFVTYFVNATTRVAEIGNNAVLPGWQGHGIGTRMYAFVLERMRQEGIRFAKVHTGGDPAHAPARAAYERVGFGKAIERVEYHLDL